MLIKITVALLNTLLKFLGGYLMYLLATWFNFPDWATIVMVVMGVNSSWVTYTVKTQSNDLFH